MTILYDPTRKKDSSATSGLTAQYGQEREMCMKYFERWSEPEQVHFVEQLLARMCHYQHGHINTFLKPMLQRDFISLLPSKSNTRQIARNSHQQITQTKILGSTEKGLDHVAESILSYLDADSLCAAEMVCKEWYRVISEGMLWKKLIERKVRTDSVWRGLAERRGWYVNLINNCSYLQDEIQYRVILITKITQDTISIQTTTGRKSSKSRLLQNTLSENRQRHR